MNKADICLLGSTGSIGCNTLEVVDNLNSNGYDFNVRYLTTNQRIDILAKQIEKYKPAAVAIQNEEKAKEFISTYDFKGTEILSGAEGVKQIAREGSYDIAVSAIVGFMGLVPTMEAAKRGKKLALANKETLVAAGHLVRQTMAVSGSKLLPIDSEHSAILQCLTGESMQSVAKLILTASGGPFRQKTKEEISSQGFKEALNHPNWKMGEKITIDSATLMNKGLEVIEAKWLFDFEPSMIEVVVHPQSIIHSMVEFKDGSVKAQLGLPDMKIPIQYALTYPERSSSHYQRTDFLKVGALTFEAPDTDKFPCLKIAYDALESGGTYPAVMNAANEAAVDLYLNGKLGFYDISDTIKKCMDSHNSRTDFTLEDVINIDTETRNKVYSMMD